MGLFCGFCFLLLLAGNAICEKCDTLRPGSNTSLVCPEEHSIDVQNLQIFTNHSQCSDMCLLVRNKYTDVITYTLKNMSVASIPNNTNNTATVMYNCTARQCALLKAQQQTVVPCSYDKHLQTESMKIFTNSDSCTPQEKLSGYLYTGEIQYTRINHSAIELWNNQTANAVLIFNCSDIPMFTIKVSCKTDFTTTKTEVFQPITSTSSTAKSTFSTERSLTLFQATTAHPSIAEATFLSEKASTVAAIAGGVGAFVVLVISTGVAILLIRRKRRLKMRKNTPKSLQSTKGHNEACGLSLDCQKQENSNNECFELDPAGNTYDTHKGKQNMVDENYFVLEQNNQSNQLTHKYKKNGMTKKPNASSDTYDYDSASNRETMFDSNNSVYDHLGDSNKHKPSIHDKNQSTYGHLGTMTQVMGTSTSTYDHIPTSQRQDSDGLYDISQRPQTDDDYDISGNFNRSLAQNDGLYDVAERKQTDDDYDVSVTFDRSKSNNNDLYSSMNEANLKQNV